jgi:hypothetical protein
MKEETVKQAIEAKNKLQERIEVLICEYEEKYDTETVNIIIDRTKYSLVPDANALSTFSVKLDIRLRD